MKNMIVIDIGDTKTKNLYVAKIKTTEGEKIGFIRDLGIGFDEEEEKYWQILEDKRYSEEEIDERIDYWCKKLGLTEFNVFEHEILK